MYNSIVIAVELCQTNKAMVALSVHSIAAVFSYFSDPLLIKPESLELNDKPL